MSEYICDDRVDTIKIGKMINSMTDEEFEAYCKKLKTEQSNKTK